MFIESCKYRAGPWGAAQASPLSLHSIHSPYHVKGACQGAEATETLPAVLWEVECQVGLQHWSRAGRAFFLWASGGFESPAFHVLAPAMPLWEGADLQPNPLLVVGVLGVVEAGRRERPRVPFILPCRGCDVGPEVSLQLRRCRTVPAQPFSVQLAGYLAGQKQKLSQVGQAAKLRRWSKAQVG